MLWLALCFPQLPLEAHRTGPGAGAVVVQQGRVIVVDDVAAAAGLMPGMRLSTARGMLPELAVVERDAGREKAALQELACFAGGFTPTVCVEGIGDIDDIADGSALLLEVDGCRRLFGGLRNIADGLRAGCMARGISVRCGAAPTPLAALWLARGATNGAACCLTGEALPAMLAPLPLSVLAADGRTLQGLAAFGLRRLGDVFALPRAGLARRLGTDFVDELACALGEIPDPRAPFVFPERFDFGIELPAPAEDVAMLLFPAQRLVTDFCGWLAIRQAGAAACMLRLTPERRGLAVEEIELRLAAPGRDAARFMRVLRERLERHSLAAPVARLALLSGAVSPLPGNTPSLLAARQPEVALEVLVERLRARLGETAVHAIAVTPDHRPECASRRVAVGFAGAGESGGSAGLRRPLYLLERSEALPEIDGQPQRRGEALELVAGPERIEAGWWDAGEKEAPGDVRRDYFIARAACAGRGASAAGTVAAGGAGDRAGHEWLWIYRDAAGWHAQGVFC